MRPSPARLARQVPKPLKTKVQVFRGVVVQESTPTPRVLRRANILANGGSILPAPVPQAVDAKPPTLLETLMAKQRAAPESWPPNLRIEPTISRATWAPVKKGVRSKLKRMLKEA
ncbi:hypothetical protein HMN09_00047600 [Mycena chlorophos]|uniref:Uncharacterized protein n=1 Tax=Mycena chlorophos TaxID=658473 RepID=A0A8H6TRJ3_MYCCL|nr:hypothetical protein HMN09_00047600 [Mycena chlorophos]